MEVVRRKPVILLVEDDPGDHELTRRALAESETDLRIATDGEKGLDYLHRRGAYTKDVDAPRPDLVLLDLNLPRIDGRHVLKTLRSEPDFHDLPVVVFSTSSREEDISQAYELGCNSFITKPLEVGAFMETVRAIGSYWLEFVKLPSARGDACPMEL